jgi:hypothetical protein
MSLPRPNVLTSATGRCCRKSMSGEAISWAALVFQDDAENQVVLRIKAASNAMARRAEAAHEARGSFAAAQSHPPRLQSERGARPLPR